MPSICLLSFKALQAGLQKLATGCARTPSQLACAVLPRRAPNTGRIRLPHVLALLGVLAVGGAGPALAGQSQGQLENGISASNAREEQLGSAIKADTSRIESFQGSINDLKARLDALERSLQTERELLERVKSQLSASRTRLASLVTELAQDRKVLIAQVVAAYESPPPSIVTVILQAHGFADLIERIDDLKAIGRQNAQATTRVADARRAVAAETKHLAALFATRQRETAAVLVQRDEVARLHIALVDRQLRYVHARDRKSAELAQLRSHKQALESELSKLQASELRSQSQSFASSGPVEYSPSGEYGFFPAPGTNYSVGEEPVLAARLNTLGKALHIHLIGISGYRSPQHSVEVGGFANDPHTRGEASDTPGVEGVPESVLKQFGLTRPFPGAAEADHIQLA
jgi:peptidoglycan hydrolase CwlO-like protein